MNQPSSNNRIANLREDYRMAALGESDVDADPLVQFSRWFDEALKAELPEANAMALATTGPGGQPTCRVVLLKGLEQDGFTFYTNYSSAKGEQIAADARVALTFLWYPIERQVRIEGVAEKVPAQESDEYFAQRPVGSQLGAWASPQSQVIERSRLEEELARVTEQYGDKPPRPPHWGGYRVMPTMLEFWQGRRSRLHDRIRYQRSGDGWVIDRLGP